MLRNLELAREKARIKRKEQGELSQLKKELAQKTKQEEIQELKQKLGKEQTVEPESDEEETPQPVKKKKKAKKPIVIVEESESDSEDEQVVYIKRKSNKPKILHEEPLIPDTPPAPVPQYQPPVSPYQGMHPSMLSRRRF